MPNRYGGDIILVTAERSMETENWKKIGKNEYLNHLETRRKQLDASLANAAGSVDFA